jgi:mRNA-degrading endonuclease RelE of RelBE toxin-antitoxin system
MTGYQIAFTKSFYASLDELDDKTRKHVREAIDKVHEGHPSVRVHKLEGIPWVAFGVNQNALRVICHRDGQTLVLCHVGKHDPAYQIWARNNRFVQAGDHIRIVRSVEATEGAGPASADVSPGPLTNVEDPTFARFDVQPLAARVLRMVPDEETLADLLVHFPVPRANALFDLASDLDAAAELASRYAADTAAGATAPTLAAALANEANSAQIWLASPEDEAVKRALEGGLATWRVFLHPSQRRLVRTDARGPLKIGGGPGTGKTVVALHRARWLAEVIFSPDLAGAARPVLVTTFNSVLARQLEPMLDELCEGAPELRARIVVMSTTRVAQALLKKAGKPNRFLTDVEECWTAALEYDSAARGRAFYDSERTGVLARSDAWTEKAYLEAKRAGRSTRLDRAARKEVWKVLEAFEAALVAQGGGDDIALARDASALVANGTLESPYSAIVCDESQDLGATDLRLLAALARDPATGMLRHNALTLCGDAYQRLYRVPVPWSACGIDVRGRSKNLKLNYRTTEAIRAAAVSLVSGRAPEDADDTDAKTLDGYRALRRGVPPEEHTFPTPEAEADWIASLAQPAKKGEPARGTLLVLARTNDWLDRLEKLLVARGHVPRRLGQNDLPNDDDPLVLCTLHRAKGLEAPRVVLSGRQLVPVKFPGGGDASDRATWDAKELASLYVGMTRARDWCGVSVVGKATPERRATLGE